ncbi:LacI family DNA-binding transcriptional regulator [Actinopolymorpha alba]|uniref:LacI family DNA-binding transcriptional regulator n=1 Tax=Actinopolymorpha alba TaxID=533267 RepID=UPI000377ED6C|nr:LacI family DNA-binding transcriptional regulator [Actinopolymorpha alba]
MGAEDRRPATIYDVAERAGVSIATVSRALHGSSLVAAKTRDRVVEVARTLRYNPSQAGRQLAQGRYMAMGIVFPDLAGPYYAEVILGYEDRVAAHGCSVLILATHRRPNAEELAMDLAGRVDGMVIMGRTIADRVVARIADQRPVVLLARPPVGEIESINADNTASAERLTEHLLGHGYQRFAFLGDPRESPDVGGRYAGFRSALAAAGRRVPRPIRCGFSVAAGHEAALALLRKPHRPQALVCANDEVALGVLSAADELGLSVPAEVAVTGWDDILAARPARLTTVRQPMRELGATAASWLHERILGERVGGRHEVLATELVTRASCGEHPG